MENKNKIKELEKKVLESNKWNLVEIMDPLMAGLEEMRRSFSSIFWDNWWENKINLFMEKFEKKWIEKKI